VTLPIESDRELWQRVRKDDREAFAFLFDRYADSVYNYCFRRSADWAAAEDIVSSVFVEAWRRRADLEITSESGRLLPWLLGVATNLLRSRNRSASRLARALLRKRHRTHSYEPDFADDAVARMADEQQMRAVLASVRSLPQAELDALALYALAGLSYEEVAAALGVPVGTVRSRLSRARARLGDRNPTVAAQRESEVTP
jgi:RNA polymerase sigma-70 factor (ECF subfamily)